MIYCQVLPRLSLPHGQPLRLSDMARTLGLPEGVDPLLRCPEEPGVWRVKAIAAAEAIRTACPGQEVTMLGVDACTVRRAPPQQPDRTKPLRTAAAMLILFMGSMLGMTWFHSDVDMPAAMAQVYQLLTGQLPANRLTITIPYVIGVAAGTGVFYALGKRRAITPLDVKYSDYRDDMDRAEARDVE